MRKDAKFCSQCGRKRRVGLVEDNAGDTTIVRAGREGVVVLRIDGVQEEEGHSLPLWKLSGQLGLFLQRRIYGKRPQGLPKTILWGTRFLKEHYCYRKQYRKVLWNHRIVRSWFRTSSDPLVDEFLNSASLCWNKDLVKKLHAYICERCRRAKDLNEDNVESIRFPDDGITMHWETKEIVHYLMEHKNTESPPRASQRNEEFNVSKMDPLLTNNKVSHCELGYRRGVYGVEERGVFVVGVTVMESKALVNIAKLPLSSSMVCNSFFLFLALNFV